MVFLKGHTISLLPELGKEEATPVRAEEVMFGAPEEQTPSMIVKKVLGALEPQEEAAESESGDDRRGI